MKKSNSEWKILADFIIFWKHFFRIVFFQKKIFWMFFFFLGLKKQVWWDFFLKENNFKQKKTRIHLEYLR